MAHPHLQKLAGVRLGLRQLALVVEVQGELGEKREGPEVIRTVEAADKRIGFWQSAEVY